MLIFNLIAFFWAYTQAREKGADSNRGFVFYLIIFTFFLRFGL